MPDGKSIDTKSSGPIKHNTRNMSISNREALLVLTVNSQYLSKLGIIGENRAENNSIAASLVHGGGLK